MKKTTIRVIFALLALSYVLSHFAVRAHAQSSLGIGTNEAMVPSTGLFSELLNWINVHQQQFYRSLTGSLKAMRDGESGGIWLLVGLSFAYGIFHAAGPGHGKAVISSYMLANEVALRRGVMLSFVSAFLQGATAVVLMTLVFLVLRGTSVSMTNATWFLETVSYALIAAFGAWLLWKKLKPMAFLAGAAPVHSLSAAHVHTHDHHDHASCGHDHSHDHHDHTQAGCGHDHSHDHSTCDHDHSHAHQAHNHAHHDHGHIQHAHAPHAHAVGEVCSTCGHSHAPDPRMLEGKHFDWRTAWSAVAAVGIRPCSGALIVLSFAFLNGLWAGGILSVFAMALGTAITVSALAIMAVTAKNWAVTIAGDGRAGNRVHNAIEIGGAALVMLLGLVLLAASLKA